MIDKNDDEKNAEEYHLGDDDLLDVDVNTDEDKSAGEKEKITDKKTVVNSQAFSEKNFSFLSSIGGQNKFVVFGALFGLFIIYYFTSWIWQHFSSNQVKSKIDNVASTQMTPNVKTSFPITPTPRVPDAPSSPSVQNQSQLQANFTAEINGRLSQIINDEQKTQADIQAANTNILNVQTNINQIIQKIAEMEKSITAMTQTIDAKIKQMRAVETKHSERKRKKNHHKIYTSANIGGIYIQAIIPGRAWLIDKNGADTITVREGTKIPGHGVVKVIDPNQGQVVLSTGEIIKFGQWDN